MKFSPFVLIVAFVLLICVVVFARTPMLTAQGDSRDRVSGETMARRSPSLTRRPTQTRVPTRKPSQTRVVSKTKTRTPARKPSHTRVIRRTHTKTKTRVPTMTRTHIPTTTPSTVPTATATPTPVTLTPADTVEFVNVGSSDWQVSVNGVSAGIEPVLELQKGETYAFRINAGAFHPMLLSTDGTTANEYTDGVSPTGGSTTSITFAVSASAPATLYYVCVNHPGMRGRIVVVEP
jgi:plastocyanin